MKNRQIQFFMLPDDVKEIDEYIRDEYLIIGEPTTKNNFVFLDSLTSRENGFSSFKYLVKPEHKDLVVKTHIVTQKHYIVDILSSPIIEFWYPQYDNNNKILKNGRIYYVKNTYDKNNKSFDKLSDFIESADKLFQWIRNHFINQQVKGYRSFLFTKRVSEWVKNENGQIVEI